MGTDPFPSTPCPLIGKLDDHGLYVATGTYRDGLHWSPVIATALTAIIDGEDAPIVESFAPTRRFTELMTKEVSMDEYAMQAVSWCLRELVPPNVLHERRRDVQECREKARSIYEDLQTDIGLHPDILLLLSSDTSAIQRVSKYLKTVTRETA